MSAKISSLSVIFMVISCSIATVVPFLLLVFFRVRKKADILPFFVGCLIMLVFALVLESAMHQAVLSSPLGALIQGNTLLYALYGGLAAGFFEETGRLFAFKTLLRKRMDKDANALMYGAGHGGFESVLLIGMTMINNLIWTELINSGNTAVLTGSLTGEALAQVEASIQTLIETQPLDFLMGGIERLFAIALHISLSVLVWFAVKKKGKFYLFPMAILIHALVDALSVVIAAAGLPTAAVEAVVGTMSLAAAVQAKKVWNECRSEEQT